MSPTLSNPHAEAAAGPDAVAALPALLHTSDYPPNEGGIARLCREIAAGLNRAGVATEVVHTVQGGARGGDPPVPAERIPGSRPWRDVRCWKAIRRRKPSLVVGGLWYPDGLVALLAGARNLVLLAHGLEFLPSRRRWREPVWKRLRRWVCESAALVVANSHYTEGLVRAAAPGSRVVTIPLGVDHLVFHPGDAAAARERLGIQADLVISSVARLYPYKGHDTVLRAMASLPDTVRARFLYLIAGQGPALASLRRCAGELGLLARVRFLGFVPEERLPDVYRASDVFVLCSRESASRQEVEGFGLVFLEAQACGVPVIGGRTGGIPEAIREGSGGWLVEPDDIATVAGLLEKLAEDPGDFRRAGAAARRRVEQSCTWGHYLGRFLEALETHGLLRGCPQAARALGVSG